MATTTKKLRLRRGDRRILESWVRSRTLPRRQVERAKVRSWPPPGENRVAASLRPWVSPGTRQRLWMRRYEAEGLDGIESDRPRSGRPRTVTRKVEEKIVQKTTGEDPPPEESTHWTSRLMGKALGIDHVTIWRIWRKYGLTAASDPSASSFPRDPRLVEKLHDVVGVYMNPPEQRRGLLLRREEPDPGSGPHPARPPAEEGPSRHHDARLQAPRHHHPLCGPERRHRPCRPSSACPGTGIRSF